MAATKILPPDENLAHLVRIESDLPAEFLNAIVNGKPLDKIPTVRSIKARQRAALKKAGPRAAREIEQRAQQLVDAGKAPNVTDATAALLQGWERVKRTGSPDRVQLRWNKRAAKK